MQRGEINWCQTWLGNTQGVRFSQLALCIPRSSADIFTHSILGKYLGDARKPRYNGVAVYNSSWKLVSTDLWKVQTSVQISSSQSLWSYNVMYLGIISLQKLRSTLVYVRAKSGNKISWSSEKIGNFAINKILFHNSEVRCLSQSLDITRSFSRTHFSMLQLSKLYK